MLTLLRLPLSPGCCFAIAPHHPFIDDKLVSLGCGAAQSERRAVHFVAGWRSRERLTASRRGEFDMASAVQGNKSSPIEGRPHRFPDAAELAQRLAREAEAVCRHYLFNGRRVGNYWQVGDVKNTTGRSMFVRLRGDVSGKRIAGKWTDAATGEHGDLLDVIRESCGFADFRQAAAEARRFLSLPRPEPDPDRQPRRSTPTGSSKSARRLFAMSHPIKGTMAEAYLRARGITALPGSGSLRFHPRCYYRSSSSEPAETYPAMIAAVTDLRGRITGVHRTYLDPEGFDRSPGGKAPIDTPRRAMGSLLGNAVRFGFADDVMAAGEGIETMLSLRCVSPQMPMAAALSAAHLGAILLPAKLRRLYIVCDDDLAGRCAMESLAGRARANGIEAIALSPRCGDFNEDLQSFGVDALRAAVRVQLAPIDAERFMTC